MLRKTRKRYFILSAIAFVAGLFIAGFVSVLYIKYNNSYMNENKEIEKTIVVLDMNLKKGTILSGEHFRKVKIHSEENSINSVKTEEVLGKELKQDMKKGMIGLPKQQYIKKVRLQMIYEYFMQILSKDWIKLSKMSFLILE